MSLPIEIVCAAAATLALFGAPSLLLARTSGLGLGPVGRPLAEMTMRLLLVSALAVALAVAAPEHRVANLLTIAATYVAAALLDGVRRFRKRGAAACSAR
jgi:hypothetical protein